LVEVKAAGINPVDTYIRTGTYAIKPKLPYTPGSDVAGIVKDVGKNVTKFKVVYTTFFDSTDISDCIFLLVVEVLQDSTGSYIQITSQLLIRMTSIFDMHTHNIRNTGGCLGTYGFDTSLKWLSEVIPDIFLFLPVTHLF